MVKSIIGDVVTYYPSPAYQVKTDGVGTNTRKYYNFGGNNVALHENGALTWLLTDHLNSTSITANEDGSLASEIRYTAFGEVRYSNGVTITDNRYTGQREEAEIGLYYYVARWYDPVIGHFLQADTIIPQPGKSIVWDRYGYANHNPVRYTDPTGHRACEGTTSCSSLPKSTYTKQYYQTVLKQEYGWTVAKNINYQETKFLAEVAWDMRMFYTNNTGGRGKEWMDKNVGNVHFTKGDTIQKAVSYNRPPTSCVFPQNTVHLVDNFIAAGKKHIAHEVNHVVDNHMGLWWTGRISTFSGGGPADGLIRAMGGVPDGVRWWSGNLDVPSEAEIPGRNYSYANNSNADYFAESLAFLMYPNMVDGKPEAFPNPNVQEWLVNMIRSAK